MNVPIDFPAPANAEIFEDFCRDLFAAEWGDTGAQKHGRSGQKQRGVDVFGLRSGEVDGAPMGVQCKVRKQSAGSKLTKTEIEKEVTEARTFEPPLVELVIATTATPDEKAQKTARDLTAGHALKDPHRFRVRVMGWSELVELLADHPTVLAKWRGPLLGEPLFWNALNRNEFFTGREELLAELEARLEEARTAALTQAITGLGGVGKTQTAIEYCHRHRSCYPGGVYWVDASSADRLLAAYAQLAVSRRLVEPGLPVDDAASALLRDLAGRTGWLMVLDNADDPDAVRELLPPNTAGHVLVTTRASAPSFGRHKPLDVNVLPAEQAIAFLIDRGQRDDDERSHASILAKEVGFLPLALEQAGAYLARHATVPIADYLSSFRKRRIDLVEEEGPEYGPYHATVATTWEISVSKLEDTAAGEAIEACGFLAPDGIPLELFTVEGARLGPALGALVVALEEDPLQVHGQLVEPLTRYSLLRFNPEDGGRFAAHRLVQEVIRRRLSADGRLQEVHERVHSAMESAFPLNPTSPSSWAAGMLWIPQVQAGLDVWNEKGREQSWDPTSLWLRAASNAWSAGRSHEALSLETQALEVRRHVLGEEHPDTLISMNNLAATLMALGDAAGGRDLLQRALEVGRSVLGDAHPDTLTSMSNLAATLMALGDAGGARDLQAQALEVRTRVFGPEHPDTLSSTNSLAATLGALGDAAGARDLHAQALAGYRRVLGEEHPDTLSSMNNLAANLMILGYTAEARDLHDRVQEVCRDVLGAEHPDTLTSMNNLAETLSALGDTTEARDLHEQALGVRRRVFGDEHPDTLMSMNNLAMTLNALGDTAKARDLLQRALKSRRRVFGDEHPDTLNAMRNLLINQEGIDTSSVDQALVAELLAGVAKLPEGTPIRVAAERDWLKSGT